MAILLSICTRNAVCDTPYRRHLSDPALSQAPAQSLGLPDCVNLRGCSVIKRTETCVALKGGKGSVLEYRHCDEGAEEDELVDGSKIRNNTDGCLASWSAKLWIGS